MGHVALAGEVVAPGHLRHRLAVSMVGSIRAENSFSTFVECRRDRDDELVVFDVEVERPQLPVNDIKRLERIAVRFRDDGGMPETLALRDDFPRVPHLNLRAQEHPRSLCLYDQPWEDLRPNWSSGMHLGRIQWWLSQTSRGELHADDQPLEPLLFTNMDLIVSADLGRPDGPKYELVHLTADDSDGRIVIVSESITGPMQPGKPFLVLALRTTPRIHGVIYQTPGTLKELAALVDVDGADSLLDSLRSALWELPRENRGRAVCNNYGFAIVLALPKTRTPESDIETIEYMGFLFTANTANVGVGCGAWELHNGVPSMLFDKDSLPDGGDLQGEPASVIRHLTRSQAALYSGREEPDDRRVLAVGVGALGSQVVMNLARAGFGQWTLVDQDRFMPHNAVRHLLFGGHVTGLSKVSCVAACINALTSDGAVATPLQCDFLAPSAQAEGLDEIVEKTGLILDLSTSISVARRLSFGEHSARAISLFLSPNGEDLVLLCEGKDRSVRLIELEMAYYLALAVHPQLAGHLDPPAGAKRYGGGCRDVAVMMPQFLVSMHAGVAANAVLKLADSYDPAIRVWRSDPKHLGLIPYELPSITFRTAQVGRWSVSIGRSALEAICKFRDERLPNETGGILIGNLDHDQEHIFIVAALPSPPDSEEWPTVYIRGTAGLQQERDRIVEVTAGNLDYLGEWHSHPRGQSPAASTDDRQVFGWISKNSEADGKAAVMCIASDARVRVFIDAVDDFMEVEYV